jgi:hypothetical protein
VRAATKCPGAVLNLTNKHPPQSIWCLGLRNHPHEESSGGSLVTSDRKVISILILMSYICHVTDTPIKQLLHRMYNTETPIQTRSFP